MFTDYDLTDVAMNPIKEINKQYAKMKLTDDGLAQKKESLTNQNFKNQEFFLHVNCYLAILPLFKNLVLIIEQKKTLIHRIYDMLVDNFRTFLMLFYEL